MAMATPDALELHDFGVVDTRETDLDGYVVTFLHVKQSVDMSRMLKGLPDDICPCPHWGILTDGQMTVRYTDHEEVVKSGDVFYMPPGHVPVYEPGTRLIFFSPTAEAAKVNEVIERNHRELAGG